MEVALIAAAIVIAAALIAVALIFRRGTAAEEAGSVARLQEELAKVGAAQAGLVGQLSQMTEAQTLAQKTLNERIDQFSTRVNQSLTEQTTKTHENLSKLQERLAVIDTAQKNITELSGQVVTLQDVLSNKQARGAFGEVQLEDIVRDVLPDKFYSFQTPLSNGKQPDCLVRFPDTAEGIAIDSKFPLEAFNALHGEKVETPDRTAAKRAFIQSIRKHINDIAGKYIIPGETEESAIMFLPSEAVFAELHSNFMEVVREAHKRHVLIVSPNTLMALLLTARAKQRDIEMREQAHVIQAEVRIMMEDVERLQARVDNLDKHFERVQKDIGEITTSAKKISDRGARIEAVELQDSEPPKKLPGSGAA